jgi:hypothetical protein
MPANSTIVVPENPRMLRKHLMELNGKRPLEPFRIHLTDGRTFDVRYPNMLLVMNTFLSIGIPEVGVPDPVVDYFVDVEMPLVRAIELLANTEQQTS